MSEAKRGSGRRAAGAGEGFSESADQRYFRAIEEEFLTLRGAPILLTPNDWQLARDWRRRGVPLGLVLETMRELFAKRAERGAKGRVSSLKYCAAAVEKAWAEQLELGVPRPARPSPAPPSAPDVRGRLEQLAGALPLALPAREQWCARLGELARIDGAEEVEQRLAELDEQLVSALLETLPEPERHAVEAAARAAVAGVSARLGDRGARRALRAALAKEIRRRFELPVLSLFGEL